MHLGEVKQGGGEACPGSLESGPSCKAADLLSFPALSSMQLLAEHNVAAVLSGHLHGSFGQRLHRVHSTPAGGHMAELETTAWKDDRRFRCG